MLGKGALDFSHHPGIRDAHRATALDRLSLS
jgi:hypothetical protein